MEIATYINISISEFWEMTPRELSICKNSYEKRKSDEVKEYEIKFKNQKDLLIYQAFLTSRFVWQKKIDIKKILEAENIPEKKKMSDDEMLCKAIAINNMLGGKLTKIPKERG